MKNARFYTNYTNFNNIDDFKFDHNRIGVHVHG